MDATLTPMVTEVMEVQEANAELPMLVTLLGMTTDVIEVLDSNTSGPMILVV